MVGFIMYYFWFQKKFTMRTVCSLHFSKWNDCKTVIKSVKFFNWVKSFINWSNKSYVSLSLFAILKYISHLKIKLQQNYFLKYKFSTSASLFFWISCFSKINLLIKWRSFFLLRIPAGRSIRSSILFKFSSPLGCKPNIALKVGRFARQTTVKWSLPSS